MNIKTKFNIGDDVYYIMNKSEETTEQCKACKGTGIVHIKETDEPIQCPSCQGAGYHLNYESNYVKEHGTVEEIYATVTNSPEEIQIEYTVRISEDRTSRFPQNILFTKKEADKMIKTGEAQEYALFNEPVSVLSTTIPKKLY